MKTEVEDYRDAHFDTDDGGSCRDSEGPSSSAKCVVLESYSINNALKLSRNATYSTEFLYQQMGKNEIDLDPEYQRDIVWSKEKQMMLIHSIFWNYYIPPVIFSVQMQDDGSQRKICIDGKQRLTSIRLFMDGLIPFKDHDTGQLLWYRNNPRQPCCGTKLLLPEKFKSIFKAKQVVCVEYDELDGADERDVFQRVQLGVPLTIAEKLQAISTPRSTFVKELRSKYLTKQKLGNPSIPWDRSRSRDFHVLSLLVYYASQWNSSSPIPMAAMPTLQTWMCKRKESRRSRVRTRTDRSRKEVKEVEGSDSEAVDEEDNCGVGVPKFLQKKIGNTLEIVSQLMNDSAYNKPLFARYTKTRTTLSPVDMLAILLLVFSVSQFSKTSNDLVTLSQLCDILRRQLRMSFPDIRMSTNSVRLIQEFCLEAAADPETVIRLYSKSGSSAGAPSTSSRTNKIGGKRKVSPCADSEDERSGMGTNVRAQSVKSESSKLGDSNIGKTKKGSKAKRAKR